MEEDDVELPLVELYYEYEAIQEEDVARGVFWMFVLTLGSFLGMVGVVFSTYDGRFKPRDVTGQAGQAGQAGAKSNTMASRAPAGKLKH